ncbi:ankyrin repeat-containing protein BDA1-like [Durio zibethinus]|uniref:Ankyrin repeat-containing protein BDA1-like n=1 Tax=Durio zibethinus TaxID=66656 RepID=A0A6P5Y8D0_DURZI|nr:ankyrin repeat-containing protein BDA1-like [Durio zibethinus]XP_022736678.1 ankyrin repeat-containing protein BDA1-like [Durio zibethinus]
MDHRLKKAAENGDVDMLYALLAQDPYLLDRIDQIPIVETPLHVAACFGMTHFALEIATLKPSLALKLNHIGLSPMHLALQNGHIHTVRGLITIDPELIRVKGRGRFTPLHYVAGTEELDLLAEFLSVCPGSIEDLTVRCETAVHVAVKNHKSRAVNVLVGWLKRVNKEEILNWKDEDGNTILHITACTNQPEVMKSIIRNVNVNAKNLQDLTAMDICLQHELQQTEVGDILRSAKAKRASSLATFTISLANYLSQELSLLEKRDKYLGLKGQNKRKSPSNIGNVILVVAILMATAAYQAVLSPPGGFWQDDYNPPVNNTYNLSATNLRNGDQRPHWAGDMINSPTNIIFFFTLNSATFYASVSTILIIIMGLPYSTTLYISACFFLLAYSSLLADTYPYPPHQSLTKKVAGLAYVHVTYLFSAMIIVITLVAFVRHKRRKWRVDFLTRNLGDAI